MMGLGSLFRTATPRAQESRMIVSDGWRIDSSAEIGTDTAWAHTAFLRALAIPGVDRAVTLLSDLLGSLPWDAFTDHGRDYHEKITPRPPLLEQPNPRESRVNTFSAWAADLVLHGNAIGLIADRNRNGTPTAVLPVQAANVGVRRVNGSTHSAIPTGAIEYQIGNRVFDAEDVLHIKGLHQPGELRGAGVMERHLRGPGRFPSVLGLAEELARQAGNISRDGVPTGVLKAANNDVTPDKLAEAKQGWLRSQRDRTIAALGPGTDFTPLSWNPDELQLVEARQFSLLEVANAFGIPPRFLGASSGSSMTYSNSETEAIDLVKFGLSGHLARIEQALTLLFPRGTSVQANLDALLRADTKARYAAHQTGITAGFLLRSEARSMEDLPPVPGIDDPPAQQPEQGQNTDGEQDDETDGEAGGEEEGSGDE